MKNYSILTVMVPLPEANQPTIVALPDNAIPLHLEYMVGRDTLPSCLVHYLVPCDEGGTSIEKSIASLYETAWNELNKCFGERMQQDELDLMDSVLKGVMLEVKDEAEMQEEK